MKKSATLLLALTLTACTGLPKVGLTPISADLAIGGQHEVGTKEDAVVKMHNEERPQQNSYIAEDGGVVNQHDHYITEYPIWLVIGFGFLAAVGIPSPIHGWLNKRNTARLEEEVASKATELSKLRRRSTDI